MKRLVLLLAFNCWVSVGFAQQILWDREWAGGQGFNSIFSNIAVNTDTSVVVSGVSTLGSGNGYPAHWVKYDKNGTQIWQKYGRVLASGEQDIITYGNGYMFVGTQKAQNAAIPSNYTDLGVHWLNSNGDTLQNNRFGSPLTSDVANKIMPIGSDIFILGYLNSSTSGFNLDYSLLKLSNNGTTQQWFKTYGPPLSQYPSYFIRNSRGNLVISGISDYQSLNSTYHPYFVEVNTNGDTIRTKKIILKNANTDETTYRMFHNILETSDGNYIVSGSVKLGPNSHENFIVKLNATFNVIWGYYDAIPTFYYGFSKVQQLSDGSYVVLMSGDAALAGDYHIVKVSATGQFVSRTTYNSNITGRVLTYDWKFLGDGSVVIAGKSSIGEPYIARLGNVGIPAVVSSVAEQEAQVAKLGQSYPNPAALTVTIPYEVSPSVKQAQLQLYEVATGRIIQTIPLDVKARHLTLDLKPIRQGVYSYTLFEDGQPTATKKMVVVK